MRTFGCEAERTDWGFDVVKNLVAGGIHLTSRNKQRVNVTFGFGEIIAAAQVRTIKMWTNTSVRGRGSKSRRASRRRILYGLSLKTLPLHHVHRDLFPNDALSRFNIKSYY
jgi:hypothetical protein